MGLLASIVLKPGAEMRKALAEAQRLDLINEECRGRLQECRAIKNRGERGICVAQVWDAAQGRLQGR